jgi:hypothetical protein
MIGSISAHDQELVRDSRQHRDLSIANRLPVDEKAAFVAAAEPCGATAHENRCRIHGMDVILPRS